MSILIRFAVPSSRIGGEPGGAHGGGPVTGDVVVGSVGAKDIATVGGVVDFVAEATPSVDGPGQQDGTQASALEHEEMDREREARGEGDVSLTVGAAESFGAEVTNAPVAGAVSDNARALPDGEKSLPPPPPAEQNTTAVSTRKAFWDKCRARAWSGLKYTAKLGEAASKGHFPEAIFAGIGFFITFAEEIGETNAHLEEAMQEIFCVLEDIDDALNNKHDYSQGTVNAVDVLVETLYVQREKMDKLKGDKHWREIIDKDARAADVQEATSTIKTAVQRLQYMILLGIDRTTTDLKHALAELLRTLQWPCIDEASFQNSGHTDCTPETRTSAIAQIRDWVYDLRPE
ncbi:hypothetical protein CYLTODRAFT_454780, partial [Cylindrobasidium torrendii FP15055 ss-10]